jgi:nucleoside permease NupC
MDGVIRLAILIAFVKGLTALVDCLVALIAKWIAMQDFRLDKKSDKP